MNILELLESYQYHVKTQGRKFANKWLHTLGLDTGDADKIIACFNDDGRPIDALEHKPRVFRFS